MVEYSIRRLRSAPSFPCAKVFSWPVVLLSCQFCLNVPAKPFILQYCQKRHKSMAALNAFFVSMNTLTVRRISKEYHGVKAVDSVDFSIHKGQIVGLLGPNGAGKTTTMSIISGILAPESGSVLFDDQELGPETEIAIKKQIGFLSESNPLYQDMLVREYLDYVAGLRGMNKEERKRAIDEVVQETGLQDRLYQPIEELSKGYKQRVGLAQAILHKPDLLILDEPTEGLDPNQRVSIRDLIAKLGKERTVLISTHVLSEVQAMCDSVIILNEGKVIAQGSVDEILRQSKQGQLISLEVQGNAVKDALEKAGLQIVDHEQREGREVFTLRSTSAEDMRPKVFAIAKEQSWILYELHQKALNLEETFRQLTSKA